MRESFVDRIWAIPRALGMVFGRWPYAVAGVTTFALVFPVYLMVLPSSFTGGRIGPAAMHYLTPRLWLFAVLMAGLLALMVPVATFALRHGGRVKAASGAGGVLVAVVTPLLCCSPLIPIVIGAIAAVIPAAGHVGLPIQGFVATHETLLYAVASGLLGLGLYGNARRALGCAVGKSLKESVQ
ncbi:MAG: hypothetical protein ACRER1_08400 [Gammaproteobacteria bacterium]